MSATVTLNSYIEAAPQLVCDVIGDWADWPRTFPSTIAEVELVSRTAKSLTLRVLHRSEGPVINVIEPVEESSVRLREFKKRYDAQFTFFSEPAESGSMLHVHGCIRIKGRLRFLSGLVSPLIRSRMRKYLIEPLRLRAEQLQREATKRQSSDQAHC